MLPVFGFSNDSVVRFFLLFRNYRLVFLWALLKDDASVIGMHRTAFLFIRFIVRFLYRFLFLRFHRLILSCFIFEINFFTYRIHIIIWQSLCLMTSFLVLWLYGLILLCLILKTSYFFQDPLKDVVVFYFQDRLFFFQYPYYYTSIVVLRDELSSSLHSSIEQYCCALFSRNNFFLSESIWS